MKKSNAKEDKDLQKENNLQNQGIYTLTAEAENDLKEIWVYIAENNRSAADKLIEGIFGKFQLLADNKEIGKRQDNFIIEMRMFPFKKYHIYYFPGGEGVEIYRVLHGSRDIEGEFEDYFEGLSE